MLHTMVFSGKNDFTLVVSGKIAPYIGDHLEEFSIHWWSVGRMLYTVHWWSMGRVLLTLVISGKNALYIADQWEECPLHWSSVGRMFLILVANGKNVPYIGD
ncbi:unnamed protein product [Staurois parvus]|uniref:Uncharacterized protein n=1 Tax=Staurois parvus TaxID=386267 RepID=A0ABN9DS52_9NEOB|nr:unnamed protein product [Staurois parvus]